MIMGKIETLYFSLVAHRKQFVFCFSASDVGKDSEHVRLSPAPGRVTVRTKLT